MKTIRDSKPAETNVLMLAYIFFIACFFSFQMFGVRFHDFPNWGNAYWGMALMGAAATLMVTIVWEDMVFPVKEKKIDGGLEFRNHQTKLNTLILLYLAIPVILAIIYNLHEVDTFHFSIWSAVCLVPPVVGKLFSGVKNYNDFLRLTTKEIQYKNNEKVGTFQIKDVRNLSIVLSDDKVDKKFILTLANNEQVDIDLHEMELDDFYESIDHFIASHYQSLLKDSQIPSK